MISRGFTQPVLIDAVIAPSNIPGLPVSNFGPGDTAFILEIT